MTPPNDPVSLVTDEMIEAGVAEMGGRGRNCGQAVEAIYLAMEAARPKPVAVEGLVERLVHNHDLRPHLSANDLVPVRLGDVRAIVAALSQPSSPVSGNEAEAMSTCNKCGRKFPTAPVGHVHKCVCSGGMMVPDNPEALSIKSPEPPVVGGELK